MLCASYCCLTLVKPIAVGYLGADMNYEPDAGGNTHFYGLGFDIEKFGISDPDKMIKQHGKGDPNYLKTIYERFSYVAKKENCNIYNFSNDPNTRLPYHQVNVKEVDDALKRNSD
jgi:hypothetical protein